MLRRFAECPQDCAISLILHVGEVVLYCLADAHMRGSRSGLLAHDFSFMVQGLHSYHDRHPTFQGSFLQGAVTVRGA